jgi:hypothetical protein
MIPRPDAFDDSSGQMLSVNSDAFHHAPESFIIRGLCERFRPTKILKDIIQWIYSLAKPLQLV